MKRNLFYVTAKYGEEYNVYHIVAETLQKAQELIPSGEVVDSKKVINAVVIVQGDA